MLTALLPSDNISLEFTKDNLNCLTPYFDLDFVNSNLKEKIQFYYNLQSLAKRSLGMAHCLQHHMGARIIVQKSSCMEAKQRVLDGGFDQTIGSYSTCKSSDTITLTDYQLSGTKRWISNLHISDYNVMQISQDDTIVFVYIDLDQIAYTADNSFFTPMGMEIAQPSSIVINQQAIPPEWVLGVKGTQQFFASSNFASYCFLTNHVAIIQELFADIKKYAEKNNCGAEFELTKLEIDVCTALMTWETNLASLDTSESSNEFWHKRNTQYAFSKKTLIRIIQLILELGVSYYVDAKSEFSQRFRDAITYAGQAHPLYRLGQEFYMIDLTE